jgi:sugar/nucleoside kinase (ribokinase family)
MKQCDVAVAGEIYVDHILAGFTKWPQPGDEVFTDNYVKELGGGAAITACALGRLGRSVSLVGVIGEDEAYWIKARLANCGVSFPQLSTTLGRTGVTISISSNVDRSFFTFVGENARLEAQMESQAIIEHLTSARHVHFALPLTFKLAEILLPQLRAAGCTTSLDLGHHVSWLKDPENHRTCAVVDYLLPNELEATVMCGVDAEEYLKFTKRNGWPNGLVKLGAQGAAMRCLEQVVRALPPTVQAVDTTGAGDAFDAGFIDGLLDEASGQDCLRRGCICGSLSTRGIGAIDGLPTRDELRKCYEENYG